MRAPSAPPVHMWEETSGDEEAAQRSRAIAAALAEAPSSVPSPYIYNLQLRRFHRPLLGSTDTALSVHMPVHIHIIKCYKIYSF